MIGFMYSGYMAINNDADMWLVIVGVFFALIGVCGIGLTVRLFKSK
jgi:hypothetical protein